MLPCHGLIEAPDPELLNNIWIQNHPGILPGFEVILSKFITIYNSETPSNSVNLLETPIIYGSLDFLVDSPNHPVSLFAHGLLIVLMH